MGKTNYTYGSSFYGISQARVPEWVVMPCSWGSSQLRNQTCISYVSQIHIYIYVCVYIYINVFVYMYIVWASLVAQSVKNPPAMLETWVQSLDCWDDALEKEMATHSSIPDWRIPWTVESGGLHSMGSQESDRTQQLN